MVCSRLAIRAAIALRSLSDRIGERSLRGSWRRSITRRFFLFIGILVLLINDNQPEIFQRREHGTASANDDAGAAGMDFMPLIMPFSLGQMTVQNRNGVLRFRKAAFESLNRLRG